MVERTEVVCLNCGKRWLGKADSKRWKCTQCGSTRVKPVEALKELAEGGKDITKEVMKGTSQDASTSTGEFHSEIQEKKSAEKDVKNGEADEKEPPHNEKKKEESEERQENGKIGLSWILLIPLVIIAGLVFLKSLWNREESKEEETAMPEKPANPFGRRAF